MIIHYNVEMLLSTDEAFIRIQIFIQLVYNKLHKKRILSERNKERGFCIYIPTFLGRIIRVRVFEVKFIFNLIRFSLYFH